MKYKIKSRCACLLLKKQAFSLHLWLDRMQLACSKVDRFGVLTIHTQVSHQLEQSQPVLTRGALQGNFCDKNLNALAPLWKLKADHIWNNMTNNLPNLCWPLLTHPSLRSPPTLTRCELGWKEDGDSSLGSSPSGAPCLLPSSGLVLIGLCSTFRVDIVTLLLSHQFHFRDQEGSI